MIADNLAVVRDMEEDLFNHRDPTAVDRYVAPAYTLRTAEEGAPSGREAIKAMLPHTWMDSRTSTSQLTSCWQLETRSLACSLSRERTTAIYLG